MTNNLPHFAGRLWGFTSSSGEIVGNFPCLARKLWGMLFFGKSTTCRGINETQVVVDLIKLNTVTVIEQSPSVC